MQPRCAVTASVQLKKPLAVAAFSRRGSLWSIASWRDPSQDRSSLAFKLARAQPAGVFLAED